MINKYKDFFSALLVLLFSVLLYVGSFRIKSIGISQIGPDVFPKILSFILFIIGSVILVNELIKFRAMKLIHNKEMVEENISNFAIEQSPKFSDSYSFFYNVITTFLYLVLLDRIGFILSSGLYLFIQILLLSIKSKKKMKNIIMLFTGSFSVSVVIYLIFLYGFKLILPVGILG